MIEIMLELTMGCNDNWYEEWLKSGGVYDKDANELIKKQNNNSHKPLQNISLNESNDHLPVKEKKQEYDNHGEWFEEWIESHELLDKDKSKQHDNRLNKSSDLLNDHLKNKKNHYLPSPDKPKKFYVEDRNSLEKWLQKNEIFDKDDYIKDKKIWKYPPQNLYAVRVNAIIDLHKLTVRQALGVLQQFIVGSFNRNEQVVKVIHGKGNHSPTVPKVKIATLQWLKTEGKAFVKFYKEADKKQGGAGATIVWLK